MAVGSTPSMIQGWRPNSATNQPSSAASHGSGIEKKASRSSQGKRSSWRTEASQKNVAIRAMKYKPRPTISLKDQNRGATVGTVSQAALSICSGVACRGSST